MLQKMSELRIDARQRLQHNKPLLIWMSILGKPFRYKRDKWYLDDLGLRFGRQIEWTRGDVAAVALLPRSHLPSRPVWRAGSMVRTVEAQSDARMYGARLAVVVW
jgi:hypothetical protein